MEHNTKRKKHKISYYITLLILLIILYFVYQYYQQNNFNDFIRSESIIYTSEFIRDKNVKYGDKKSYKIKSPQYNDAMFYKTIKVEKNQPYKVTCMVKTNNVQPQEENVGGVGAQISIEGTNERSVAITGTQDWQKIELVFNSKNREEVNLGFRLGGYLGKASGEVWFSNFTIEEGIPENNSDWKFACFIFKKTDVVIDDKEINLEVGQSDVKDITNTIKLFEKSCETLSNKKMTAQCDIYEIDTPLSKLSYDDTYGYYASAEDIENQIKDIVNSNDYDHIYVVVKLR